MSGSRPHTFLLFKCEENWSRERGLGSPAWFLFRISLNINKKRINRKLPKQRGISDVPVQCLGCLNESAIARSVLADPCHITPGGSWKGERDSGVLANFVATLVCWRGIRSEGPANQGGKPGMEKHPVGDDVGASSMAVAEEGV